MAESIENAQAALRLLREIGFLPDDDTPPPPQPRYNASEAKMLAKFEQFPSEITMLARMAPGNPHEALKGKRFPRMLYKAQQAPGSGKWLVGDEVPRRMAGENENDWQRRVDEVHRFAESCQLVVKDEVEYSRAHEQGWRDSPGDALAFHDSRAKEVSLEAALSEHRDRNMSEAARAEATAIRSEHFGHLPEIPEQPRKRRGRPPKNAAA